MRPTRARELAVVGVLAALATWALLNPLYASLPPLPWTFVPALLIAAAAEAWAGWDLHRRIVHHKGDKPAPPLFVAKMVVLAKASSQTAVLLAGIAIGFVIYLSDMVSASIPRRDIITAAIGFGAALVLLAAALYLEWCCRVPRAPDRDEDDNEPAARS